MRALRSVLKVLILAVVLVALYAIGLSFAILPADWTPQALFKDKYAQYKLDLANDSAASSSTSSISKAMLDFFNKVDQAYARKSNPNIANTATNTTPADGSQTPAQPEEPKSAVDKARDTVQQYQQSIDDQKKVLDSL